MNASKKNIPLSQPIVFSRLFSLRDTGTWAQQHIALQACFALLFLFSHHLFGQSYLVDIEKLSVENGLSNRFVNALCQDGDGFIWIGTQHGLSRYDGYEFKLFTRENSGLSSNNIHRLYPVEDHKIWVVHHRKGLYFEFGEVDVIDTKTGNIQRFDEAFVHHAPFKGNDIESLCVSNQGTLISTHNGQLYWYSHHHFKTLFSAPGKTIDAYHSNGTYHAILVDDLDWLILNSEGKTIQKVHFPEKGWCLKNTFCCLNKKNNKILSFDVDSKTIRAYKSALPSYAAIIKSEQVQDKQYALDPKNHLWWGRHIDSVTHLSVFHLRQGLVIDLYPELAKKLSYTPMIVKDIIFDSENKAWIATHDGIFIVRLKEKKFTTLLNSQSGWSRDYSIRGITEDSQQSIYINTYDGQFQGQANKRLEKNYPSKIWLGAFRDQYDHVWFSGETGIIEQYDPLRDQHHYYKLDPPPQSSLNQLTIIRDDSGQVWTGTLKGLCTLDPETGRYKRFTHYNGFEQLAESGVYYLYQDDDGIWVASSSGLYRLTPGQGITARYAQGEHILHFYREKNGIFWLATHGGGVVRFNPKNGDTQRFTTTEGLSNNIIYAVYEDASNRLWMPSNYGLMLFNKKTHRVKTFLTMDGIAHNEFNTGAHFRATDSTLYFGGISGVTVFKPSDFPDEPLTTLPLRLTHCEVLDGRDGEVKNQTLDVVTTGKLTIKPSDKSFTVTFALLNYEHKHPNTYFYKLEGLDPAWTHIQGNRLRINALPYGTYTLKITAQDTNSTVSANDLAIVVTVLKPFYLKTGVVFAYAMALIVLVYGIFRWRLQQLRLAKLRLQKTVQLRTREIRAQKDQIETDKDTIKQQAETLRAIHEAQSRWFTNIAHELRTPLTLILGPLRQSLKLHATQAYIPPGPIQLAERNSTQLLQLVNEILDVSRLEARPIALHKEITVLTRLVTETMAHFDSMAKQNGVKINLSVHDQIILHLDPPRIRKILVNLISNALKFTHRGDALTISIQLKDNYAYISVKDTGEGIAPKDLPHIFERYYQAGGGTRIQQGGTGIGLSLSLELAKLHGGNLIATSEEGKGSTFTLTLPHARHAATSALIDTNDMTAWSEQPDMPPPTPKNAKDDQQEKSMILLVDDNADMRLYIRSLLPVNYQVTEAGDGMAALEHLRKNHIDLIIADVMMPRMDGFQLLERMKAQAHTASLPVIMLTARAAQEDRLHALTIGVDDYLTKPFEEEELVIRIQYLLKKQWEKKQWLAKHHAPPLTQEPPTNTVEQEFIRRAETAVLQAIADPHYGVSEMASELLTSQRQLHRQLKALTGLSPLQFIRELRLQKAYRLLKNREKTTVAEVMYAVGFQRSDYFAKVYRARFGKLPSEHHTPT